MTTTVLTNRLSGEIDPESYRAAEVDSRRHLVRTLVKRRQRVTSTTWVIVVGIVAMATTAMLLLR